MTSRVCRRKSGVCPSMVGIKWNRNRKNEAEVTDNRRGMLEWWQCLLDLLVKCEMSRLERVGWGFKYSQVRKPLLIENKSNVIHTSPNIHQNSHHHHSQWLLVDHCHPKFLQEWSCPQDFQGWIPALRHPLRRGTHCHCLLGMTLMLLMYYKCLSANYGHTCDQ